MSENSRPGAVAKKASCTEFQQEINPIRVTPPLHSVAHQVPGLRCGSLQLYLLLLDFARSTGKAWPSRSTLAKRLGVNVRTIKRQRRALEALGLVWHEGAKVHFMLSNDLIELGVEMSPEIAEVGFGGQNVPRNGRGDISGGILSPEKINPLRECTIEKTHTSDDRGGCVCVSTIPAEVEKDIQQKALQPHVRDKPAYRASLRKTYLDGNYDPSSSKSEEEETAERGKKGQVMAVEHELQRQAVENARGRYLSLPKDRKAALRSEAEALPGGDGFYIRRALENWHLTDQGGRFLARVLLAPSSPSGPDEHSAEAPPSPPSSLSRPAFSSSSRSTRRVAWEEAEEAQLDQAEARGQEDLRRREHAAARFEAMPAAVQRSVISKVLSALPPSQAGIYRALLDSGRVDLFTRQPAVVALLEEMEGQAA